ncbi:Asp23/Gls24 family envelope stress response protein [Micromonospora ureilytica]|uniref:Alkaline shock family protein YloU n=1 Tax=Micromonospora ureilytica TaxID=709868 RepID=A0ABS0JSE9_9ACTN|nr:Asp23/Gls24 family envelope stress response protein [Micromonospora ureilytica]MBG6069964.1 putative alkaline shock family protein YloU [Micromonospora ureilytica]WSR56812.1 Asp23/Gls24 family envelope stress response protein [Micromonospora ureilytica]
MTDAVENAGAVQAATGAARGVTSVSDEVVEKIAGTAARAVPGVADLGGDVSRFFNSVLDKIGLDEVGDARRGISADVKGSSAVINVVLVIDAGHVVADVTEAVRAAVIEAVEKYGLTVTQVNVTVDDIELNQPGAAAGA